MRIIIFFILLFININPSLGQNKTYIKELPLLFIKNQQFTSIIDSAVSDFKKCSYYWDTWVLGIFIRKDTGNLYRFTIYPQRSMKILLQDRLKPYGYFLHDKLLCFVLRDTIDSVFKRNIENQKFMMNEKVILYPAEYTTWYYLFKNEHFDLLGQMNKCK